MNPPEAILFDAGGTLVLQDPGELSRLLGIPVNPMAAFEAHYRAMDAYARLRMTARRSRGSGGRAATSPASAWLTPRPARS